MLEHEVVGVLSRLLAQLRKEADVSSDERLQCAAHGSKEAARPDDDAPDNAQVSDDAITRQFKGCSDQVRIKTASHCFLQWRVWPPGLAIPVPSLRRIRRAL